MSKLVCLRGGNQGDEFRIPEGTTVLGRAPDCDIPLFDTKCSRQHCQIVKKGKYYSVEDLGSRNGTHLNGKKLSRGRQIKEGDRIRIGGTILELSDKPVGNVITQTATDVAADLTGKKFGKLIENASVDAIHAQDHEKTHSFSERMFNRWFRKKR